MDSRDAPVAARPWWLRPLGFGVALAVVMVAVAGGFLLLGQRAPAAAGPSSAPARAVPDRTQPTGPRPAPTSKTDYPPDLLGADGVYREALLLQLGADESRTWDVLDQAAVTKQTVTLEIAVPYLPGRFERHGAAEIIHVPPISQDEQAAALDRRGGAGFAIELPHKRLVSGCPYGSFYRITGVFNVAYDAETFRLTPVSDEVPELPDGVTDDKRCMGTAGRLQTLREVERVAQSLTQKDYARVKSEWVASPRVWWAIRDQALLDGGGDAITDPLIEACWPWSM